MSTICGQGMTHVSSELEISLRFLEGHNYVEGTQKGDQGMALVSSELKISLRFLKRTQRNEYDMRSRYDACE